MFSQTAKKTSTPMTFRRLGGMDQVLLQTDEDWRNIKQLDPKLWMALSCPTTGLEFNEKTLKLLDSDHDGRVHMEEVRSAVEWVCERLIHPSQLSAGETEISISNLNEETDAGKKLKAAANLVLSKHGAPDSDKLSLNEIDQVIAEASTYPFNGDGVVPPDSAPFMPEATSLKDDMRQYIKIAIGIIGAMRDASGKAGLDTTLQTELNKILQQAQSWRKQLSAINLPLGQNTSAAWTLFQQLHDKLDDFFQRCNLAAYAPSALKQINGNSVLEDPTVVSVASGIISQDVLKNLPLAQINEKAVLKLDSGLNPYWKDDLIKFYNLTRPLIKSEPDLQISQDGWEIIKKGFEEYGSILANKPVLTSAPDEAQTVQFPELPTLALAPDNDPLKRSYIAINPTEALSDLSDDLLAQMLDQQAISNFEELAEKDAAAPPLASFEELGKLALFHAHLYTFLMNFLSFSDFYDPDKKAIFQTGILYLDGRASLLCVPVESVDDHVRLSTQSFLCLIYCQCQRKTHDGATQEMTIAGAVTLGSIATLIEGRHGLFIDNNGEEWDSKIIRILHNPISIREAMKAPYIRLSNLISEQIHKFAASKEKEISDATAKVVQEAPASKEAAPKQGFDFAKGAGIFAALGVALSAVSAAFAYIANSLASLGWWWPLAILAILICISGPSMFMAWLKLRQRGLGPLLDASGWAVNVKAPINLMMGSTLTVLAKLPANAQRKFDDPYGLPIKNKHTGLSIFLWIVALLIIACIGLGVYCLIYGEPVWLTLIRANLNI